MKERLRDFLREKNLNARQFADEIGVQPSSISHILTGRNKPSIELLEKMIQSFPEIDIRYLISGQQSVEISRKESVFTSDEDQIMREEDEVEYAEQSEVSPKDDVGIERVMIFYKDNSFSEYLPK